MGMAEEAIRWLSVKRGARQCDEVLPSFQAGGLLEKLTDSPLSMPERLMAKRTKIAVNGCFTIRSKMNHFAGVIFAKGVINTDTTSF